MMSRVTRLSAVTSSATLSLQTTTQRHDTCTHSHTALTLLTGRYVVDSVKVLCPTQHKMVIAETFPKLGLAWYGKTKPNITKTHIHQSKQMYYSTK